MSGSKLLDMFSELLVEVIKHLDYQSIIRCSMVRRWPFFLDMVGLNYILIIGLPATP